MGRDDKVHHTSKQLKNYSDNVKLNYDLTKLIQRRDGRNNDDL